MDLNRVLVPVVSVTLLCAILSGCANTPRGPVTAAATFRGEHVAYTDYPGPADAPRDRAVVLVHGWTSDQSVWGHQVDALSQHARVLAIDLIGHGMSDAPDIDYSMDTLASSIDAVMKQARVKHAVLIGHSNGTPAIRQFYRRWPDKVSGLVIVDGALRNLIPREAVEGYLNLLEQDSYREVVGQMVDQMLPASFPDSERKHLRDMATSTPKHVMTRTLRASIDPATWSEDPIEVPTLIVLAESPFWTPEYEQFVRRLVDEVDYITLPGATHFLMIDQANEFNALVVEFLQSISFPG